MQRRVREGGTVMRAFLLGLALAMLLASWGGEPRAAETVEQLKEKALQARPRIAPPYPGPILLTSLGQGPGASIAKAFLTVRANVPLEYRPLVQAEELVAGGTLLVVVGASNRGLKTAGTNKGKETRRAETLLLAAQEARIPVILVHIGGEEHRDRLSHSFIEKAVPYADYLIVKKDGNTDGYFALQADELRIPCKEIERFQDLVQAVQEVIPLKSAPGVRN